MDEGDGAERKCIFCCSQREDTLITAGPKRVETVIEVSRKRGDDMFADLERRKVEDPNLSIRCHKGCVSSYTSKTHVERALKRSLEKVSVAKATPPKQLRRSSVSPFNFLTDCLFCGAMCDMTPDKKHPLRKERTVLCRTADQGPGIQTVKEKILSVCAQRGDAQAREIRVRLAGAVSDLHAADGRYHAKCYSKFMSPRNIHYAKNPQFSFCAQSDEAIESTIHHLREDLSRLWNSIDLYSLYCSFGGTKSRRNLVTELQSRLSGEFLMIRIPGYASILTHISTASKVMKLTAECDQTEEILYHAEALASRIIDECKINQPPKDSYSASIDIENASSVMSETLQIFLGCISRKLSGLPLPALIIGNILSNIITNRYTPLQIALGVLLRDKHLINSFKEYRVCCTYDEILRFKSSVAMATSKSIERHGVFDQSPGLIQTISDNFDANISSQNGLKSTHGIAIIMTKPDIDGEHPSRQAINTNIPRMKKNNVSDQVYNDIPISVYEGKKKPPMPDSASKKHVMSLSMLCKQTLAAHRARGVDFKFLKDIVTIPGTPEYGGYNTRMERERGDTQHAKTFVKYRPLIDMTPNDHSTMMTVMNECQKLTNACGQVYTVSTNDQCLYKYAVDVCWVYPDRFRNYINRLGGMHFLMSFVGCVGNLMAGSGMEDILSSVFGGVPKMLSGKNFPQNVRALRLLTEECIRRFIGKCSSFTELDTMLEKASTNSKTTQHWVNNLIRPVFLMMIFVRAEREGDWLLHLWAVRSMMPYFFAAKHFNYAKYGLYYLRTMEALPMPVLEQFLRGQHTTRHNSGFFNGIWSDMLIETTFMRFGKGPGGLIGITLNNSAVKKWALSLHVCSSILSDLSLLSNEHGSSDIPKHKEEGNARVTSDSHDRQKLRDKLSTCIDPLEPAAHPGGLVNIVSGRISPENVNVYSSIDLGFESMNIFESSWPDGFHNSLSSKVITMAVTRKSIMLNDTPVYDTELIYSRVIGLMAMREVSMKETLAYELSPVPTSMFKDDGEMRITKSKSDLKNKLLVAPIHDGSFKPDALVIDGCAYLWVLSWPKNATVEEYTVMFSQFILSKLKSADIYLVFDRYFEFSPKDTTRESRRLLTSRKHQLSYLSPLPKQTVALGLSENKKQLIHCICEKLIVTASMEQHDNTLVVTSESMLPVQVLRSEVTVRCDLMNTHEEADVIMIQQVLSLSHAGKNVTVLSDDTDVFCLLMYHYHMNDLKTEVILEGTSSGKSSADIRRSVRDCSHIEGLLAAHALSGCDTTSCMFGVGKGTALKVLKCGVTLDAIGDTNAPMEEVLEQAKQFGLRCYDAKIPSYATFEDLRYEAWSRRTGNSKSKSAPSLKSLPPTTAAFNENAKRAHFQVAVWKAAPLPVPPDLPLTGFGWERDINSKTLKPILVPEGTVCAPENILKLIRCGCASDNRCSSAKCSCCKAKLSCTVFCNCKAETDCQNEQTKIVASFDQYDGNGLEIEQFSENEPLSED